MFYEVVPVPAVNVSTEGIILIIGAIAAGAVTVIVSVGKVLVEVRAGNKTTERVLVLTDGRMTAALKTIARLAKAIAKMTGDPEDIKAAETAEIELSKKYEQDQEAHS
jgi:hypothetical protein